jgi:hypothetical protein
LRCCRPSWPRYLDLRSEYQASAEEIDGKTICLLSVSPAGTPVYLTFKGKEDFYIRTGNASQPLPVSKAMRYVQTRFDG